MINKKKRKVEQEIEDVDSVICDFCKREFKHPGEIMEIQEFLNIRFTGGYGSIFGDCENIECDICQHCLKTIIEGHYRII